MTLAFPNASRSLDGPRHAVRFWGHESQFEYTFYVDLAVLERLAPHAATDEASLLRAFDDNRSLMEVAAVRAHARGRQSFYHLQASAF